jgi:hypothetical protein
MCYFAAVLRSGEIYRAALVCGTRAIRRTCRVAGVLCLLGCDSRVEGGGDDDPTPPERTKTRVSVTIDLAADVREIPMHAFGMHTSVYDNALHDEELPELLAATGITMLRYPGGGYSDNYHWSEHSMTPWPPEDGEDEPNHGYLAARSDFGHYVGILDRVGATAIITVNYGSNVASNGPGEPKEAAAWVAYANGDPDDETSIGLDGTGRDWHTVGYWAGLRAGTPLAADDGRNFLRIGREEPLGIVYWEVGNEVFGNGYYADDNGFELDLHAPYDGSPRRGNEALSPTTYGRGVVDYVAEMKAVDPSIKVGAVLNTPPLDYTWGPDWNTRTLTECGSVIDFAIVHWYTGNTPSDLVQQPYSILGTMTSELRRSLELYAGDDPERVELFMTELGPHFQMTSENNQAMGVFAANTYVGAVEHGFSHLDWLELHNGSFLSERNDRKGPAYHGIRMAYEFARPGDVLVAATSSAPRFVSAHAARRSDGAASLMLSNLDDEIVIVEVTVERGTLSSDGTRFDYAPLEGGSGHGLPGGEVAGPEPISGLGNTFELEISPLTVVDLIVPLE